MSIERGSVACHDRNSIRHRRKGRSKRRVPPQPQQDSGNSLIFAFDVLADRGRDVRHESYRQRRDRLASLVGDTTSGVILTPAVDDIAAAQRWMACVARLGIEGVVAKRLGQPYLPRRFWWEKVRSRESVEAVVGGVIGPMREPGALVVGRYDQRGRLQVVGRTLPLARAARSEVGARLRPPLGVRPWPAVLPGGRLGLAGKTDDVPRLPVAPRLVVEVDVDTAAEYGRWRHGARYRRIRADLLPEDLAVNS
ncbi:hypothetical protein [Pseudonocardia oroxyli]|uniref:ATP dependent DNA ligase domain-containing protein n=1 Tax=Pseudonocardia oroxyli TaxID=366584 RepID=A0A1G8EFM8_PSEOR|nr:ATP dependent DNA ligase domain-containing protein [Pseudonocardia oroxyli]